jgi:uncharacterized membrane protein
MKNYRDHIQLLAKHSKLSEKDLQPALEAFVYNDKDSWQKFFKLLFISLGVGFTVSGIIFFFAYNWQDLHKFAKIGIMELLVITSVLTAFFIKANETIKSIILTASSLLVGVLFAVYGQIYQTGADAYDFFLGITIFISLWVWVSNFPPLWLIYIVLINLTFGLYTEQVAQHLTEADKFLVYFSINSIVLIACILITKLKPETSIPRWFQNIVLLFIIYISTYFAIDRIFDNELNTYDTSLLILICAAFGTGIWYGFKTRNLIYIASIVFSIIVLVDCILVNMTDGMHDDSMFVYLFISFLTLIAVSLLTKGLISLQKKWSTEK